MEGVKPVLIAEDDLNDQELLKWAFESAGVTHPVLMVRDGQEAIEYLSAPDQHTPPCLVLTDVKMPRCNGFELLEWVQQQAQLRSVPVIVLTASGHESDHAGALGLGARGYFVKPNSFEDLVELARQINHGWIVPHCAEQCLRDT